MQFNLEKLTNANQFEKILTGEIKHALFDDCCAHLEKAFGRKSHATVLSVDGLDFLLF